MTSPQKKTRALTISVCRGGSLLRLGRCQNKTTTWEKILDAFREPVVDDVTMAEYLALPTSQQSLRKNENGAFVGGSFRDGLRDAQHLEFRSIVTLDIDSHAEAIWDELQSTGAIAALGGLAYMVHTTRKHLDTKPRLRVLIPLTRDVTPEEYVPIVCGLGETIDPEMLAVSSETYVSAQVMFYPSVCKGSPYFFLAVDGDFLDPTAILKKYPADKPDTWPLLQGQTIKSFSLKKIVHPEDKKAQAPIITALHRAFHPTIFIEEFLGGVYQSAEGRYLPHGATGAPSVRVYDDAFIQSDHGSDPARGQHNTFDLGRIHLFGHLDEDFDTASMSPVDWPSYKAMAEWAVEQEGVADHLTEVEEEVQAERVSGYLDELDDLADEDEDDEAGDDDDLIGITPRKPGPKAKGVDEIIRRLRKLLGKADNLKDVEAAAKRVQEIPDDILPESARSVLCGDMQAAYERCGEKLTKAGAAKALRYRAPSAKEKAGEDIPEWAQGWCFVYGENLFVHTDTNRALSEKAFDAFYMQPMGMQVGFTPAGMPIIAASTAALTNWGVTKAYGMQYHPGREEMFVEDGVTYVNRYRKAIIPDDGYRGDRGVKLLKRLLNDLYPDARNQALILDYLAHMYRSPEKKLKYALLLKGANEEGKTLLYRLMRRVLGKNNCATVQTSQLKKEFNDFIDGKLLCCIEEIKLSGKDGAEALNSLKAPISNGDVSVEGKGTKVRNIDNYCNWMVFTNFEDAVPIEDNDSRWLVIYSRFKSNAETADWKAKLIAEEGKDYRDRLFDEIETHPWQFIRFFESRAFSEDYRPSARAPSTLFKQLMTVDGYTEERTVLEELIQAGDTPMITDDYVHTASLASEFQDRGIGNFFRGKGVPVLMKQAGFAACRRTMLSVDGNVFRVGGWTRNADFCDVAGALTEKGREHIREACRREQAENEDMDDETEGLADLI